MHYAEELEKLIASYSWAKAVPIDRLLAWKEATARRPMIALGSGGSLSAAHFAALLHRHYARGQAKHITPYELLLNEPELSGISLMMLSASGDNSDILSAFETGIGRGAEALSALCMRRNSPLAKQGRPHSHAYLFEEDIPTGKDGFLATNTLLATLALLARAYGAELLDSLSTPPPIDFRAPDPGLLIQIVYGGWSAPVATDLESKLNESGLASACMNDYRNFAHGRQLGMFYHRENAHLLALITPETADIAERTLSLLPPGFSVSKLCTRRAGAAGTLELLMQALYWVKAVAMARGLDPAHPARVPDWVFQMYKLSPHP